MMPRDISDDPVRATVGPDASSGSGRQSPVSSPCVHLYRQIAPLSTIGLEHRARLAAQISERLQPTWPHQRSMAFGILYTVAPATPGAQSTRVRSYLRWSATYDTAGGDDQLAQARTRRSLREVISSTQQQLAAHYALSSVEQADVLDALGDESSALPVVELRYASWQPTAQWLSPAHIQPVLDGILGQKGAAALSIHVERMADEQQGDDSPLRLSVMAVGEATSDAALRALANEFRGCGVLAPYGTEPRHAPIVESVRREAATWAEIAHDGARLWPPSDKRFADVALTNQEAGLLLPLPMLLFEQ